MPNHFQERLRMPLSETERAFRYKVTLKNKETLENRINLFCPKKEPNPTYPKDLM